MRYLLQNNNFRIVNGRILISTPYIRSAANFKTINSGDWNDLTIWQIQGTDGNWYSTPYIPQRGNTVYIESGHTITLSNDQECYSLNYYKDSITKINTNNNTLSIYGVFRRYIGTAPGTYSGGAVGTTQWLMGNFSLKGISRTQSVDEYVAARNLYGYNLSLDLNTGQTLSITTTTAHQAFNFGGILTINTGTLFVNNAILRVSETDPQDGVSNGQIYVYDKLKFSGDSSYTALNKATFINISSLNFKNGSEFEIANSPLMNLNSITYETTADLVISNSGTFHQEMAISGSGNTIPRNLILSAGTVYNLGGNTINIRGTLQTGSGAFVTGGTLNQNHA